MDPKYMVFESLTSGCGVGLHIHMIQEDGTDALAWQDAYPEMYLQVRRFVWSQCHQLLELKVSLPAKLTAFCIRHAYDAKTQCSSYVLANIVMKCTTTTLFACSF